MLRKIDLVLFPDTRSNVYHQRYRTIDTDFVCSKLGEKELLIRYLPHVRGNHVSQTRLHTSNLGVAAQRNAKSLGAN